MKKKLLKTQLHQFQNFSNIKKKLFIYLISEAITQEIIIVNQKKSEF